MIDPIQGSCALYSRLLLAYPSDFRQRFGDEMVLTFCDQMSYASRRNGIRGIAQVWSSAIWELLSIAVPLQMQSSLVIAIALSFVGSSALFLAVFQATSLQCSK